MTSGSQSSVPAAVAISGDGGGSAWGPCLAALVALALSSCTYLPAAVSPQSPAKPGLVAVQTEECRGLLRDDTSVESLRQAITRSLDSVQKLPLAEMPLFGRGVSAADLESVLTTVDSLANGVDWPQQLCDRLRLYRVELPEPLLVTGYYEPELAASRTRTARFRYPVYRTPDDLIDVDLGTYCAACTGRVAQGRVKDGRLVPYYSRADIDGGALEGRGEELAWLDDPVEAFFLHVQGSARLRFEDGVHMQISYSSSNGRPYTSIGRLLVERGQIDRAAISLQALKNYLRAHPDEQAELMGANQRYIFFRPVVAGPIGSSGVVLTAGRSVAADARLYPPGTLAFLSIAGRQSPPGSDAKATFSRFVLVQDTGTAITGPSRIDVFWGSGATAESIAGDLRNRGELYLLLPR